MLIRFACDAYKAVIVLWLSLPLIRRGLWSRGSTPEKRSATEACYALSVIAMVKEPLVLALG